MLAAAATARQALAAAEAELSEARDMWGELLQGSTDPEAHELPAVAHECIARIGELHGQLQRSEEALRVYLDNIGAGSTGASSSTGATPSQTRRSIGPSATPSPKLSTSDVVERERAALPPLLKPGEGRKTHGRWWIGDGGEATSIVSGRDELSKRVDDLLRERGLRQRITRANDAELKLAAHMVDRGIAEASVVINNRPCTGRLSCDSLLPVLLPPGSTLTVYGTEQDGSSFVKTYHGGSKWTR